MIQERIYLFKKEFAPLLNIPKNQVDHRQEELCLWLKNFFDFEILEGSPIKIKINRILKEYEPIPRKYDSSKRKEQAKIRKEEKEKNKTKIVKKDNPLNSKGVYGIYLRGELVYIGKTTITFADRFKQHKEGIKKGKDMFLYEQLHNEPAEDIEMKPIIKIEDLKIEGAIEDRDIGSMELALITLYQPKFNRSGIVCNYIW